MLYRTWARPTLEVHGIIGGYQAPGAKTVIPAQAKAKVSMRLVPNQDADDIFKKYSDYVKKITPKGIKTSDKEYEFDIIVFATGFDAMTGPLKALNLKGRGGRALECGDETIRQADLLLGLLDRIDRGLERPAGRDIERDGGRGKLPQMRNEQRSGPCPALMRRNL